MGAHGTVVEPDGSLRLNNFGRPTLRTWLFLVEQANLLDNWDPIGLRGTASESYTVEDLFVPEEFTGTREDPTLRREPGPLYAFPQQTLYSVGIASVALGIARGMLDAFVELALRKTPRGTGRLADNAVIQAEVARAEARLGAARCYLIDTVTEIYRRASPSAPIDIPDRARARLAGSNAITERRRSRQPDLQGRRRRRDLPRQPLRAPLPRHPHPLAANPVPRRPLRNRRPSVARQPARGVFLGFRTRQRLSHITGCLLNVQKLIRSKPMLNCGFAKISQKVQGIRFPLLIVRLTNPSLFAYAKSPVALVGLGCDFAH